MCYFSALFGFGVLRTFIVRWTFSVAHFSNKDFTLNEFPCLVHRTSVHCTSDKVRRL